MSNTSMNKSNEGDDGWQWNANNTKLLVDLYEERYLRFQDPRVRKRSLWLEIVEDMEQAGYKGISADICDRKWRNMRKTYRTSKEAMLKSGRKSVAWPYYDFFEKMHQTEGRPQSSSEKNSDSDETTFNIAVADILAATSESIPSTTTADDLTVTQEQQRQLLILERSRIAAVKELSRRIDESNAIQRDRNDLLREFLTKI
ncbi:Hypothetical predicted protein [Drosophila guanche]|uniref:Myb/SANT-like DNA-binding domain-containing protein n=1 Tax=Drosophila guanche TaxID=7266 RepID=A0A3B0KK18_DROGU|nr:Hypothetical predicted protein [Drosophila guanche]